MQIDHVHEGPRAKTVAEFARDWRLGRTTVYALATQGKLRLTKIGKATRILAEDERAFGASLQQDHRAA
jgi:excisionase family DNA binding protein